MSKKSSKKPKQQDLPGMEERKIPELHRAAEQYAATRDERMELLKTEVAEKEELLKLMKQHKKEVYKFDDVEIRLVHEAETVKVKIKKDKETED